MFGRTQQATGKATLKSTERVNAKRLIQLSESDWWTAGSAFEGTQILGSTGSGKTSGSGRTIALAFMEAGWGGLVLTAKPDDLANWQAWAAASGRTEDLLVVEPDGTNLINFLDYEFGVAGQSGGLTQNLVTLINTAVESGSERSGITEPYWGLALSQLLVHAIDLVVMATGGVSLELLSDVVRTAPQSAEEATSLAWQRSSSCWRCLRDADEYTGDDERRKDFEETAAYFLLEFPALAGKTRSIVVNSFTTRLTGLLRTPHRRLFASETTITPEMSHEGRIIIVNLPVKVFGEVGRFAQVLFKTIWQRATERRAVGPKTLPVFLWADESQYFVTSNDALFQQTARSSLAATVYLTQNLPNYYAALSGRYPQHATESLLGNLQTKIFHANGDACTNEWAERVIGRNWTSRKSRSVTGEGGITLSNADQYVPAVPARAFTVLRKGGPPSMTVEGIVFEGGRTWSSGENYLRATFAQSQ